MAKKNKAPGIHPGAKYITAEQVEVGIQNAGLEATYNRLMHLLSVGAILNEVYSENPNHHLIFTDTATEFPYYSAYRVVVYKKRMEIEIDPLDKSYTEYRLGIEKEYKGVNLEDKPSNENATKRGKKK